MVRSLPFCVVLEDWATAGGMNAENMKSEMIVIRHARDRRCIRVSSSKTRYFISLRVGRLSSRWHWTSNLCSGGSLKKSNEGPSLRSLRHITQGVKQGDGWALASGNALWSRDWVGG